MGGFTAATWRLHEGGALEDGTNQQTNTAAAWRLHEGGALEDGTNQQTNRRN
jgi:hypothetical protein